MESFKSFEASEVPAESILEVEATVVEHEPTAFEQFRAEEHMFVTEYAESPAANPARAFVLITDLAEIVRAAEKAEHFAPPEALAA